jgi:hypothetical protein
VRHLKHPQENIPHPISAEWVSLQQRPSTRCLTQ